MTNKLRKARFTLDGMTDTIGVFEGYTFISEKNRWNGWAIPYFTKEVADKIAESMMERSNDVVKYRKDLNGYLAVLEGSSDLEQFSAETIDGMELYSLGGGSWVWEELEDLTYEQFEQHLHDTVEQLDYFGANPDVVDVKIEVNGKSIEIPLNADLYESLVQIMKDEIEYKKQSGGNE